MNDYQCDCPEWCRICTNVAHWRTEAVRGQWLYACGNCTQHREVEWEALDADA